MTPWKSPWKYQSGRSGYAHRMLASSIRGDDSTDTAVCGAPLTGERARLDSKRCRECEWILDEQQAVMAQRLEDLRASTPAAREGPLTPTPVPMPAEVLNEIVQNLLGGGTLEGPDAPSADRIHAALRQAYSAGFNAALAAFKRRAAAMALVARTMTPEQE